MKTIRDKKNTIHKYLIGFSSMLILAMVALLATSNDTKPTGKALSLIRPNVVNASINNPEPPSDMCTNMQVLVLLDRSGSVTNEGSAVVQQYKDQVKKVWHTLHNISATYGGYASGDLYAFAGRTSDQMPNLLARDNNKDGRIDINDRDLANLDVLSGYDAMTQDIYFRSDSGAMYPKNQTFDYGYNPKNEDTKYFTKINYTNWHEAFLMAQNKISVSNTPNNGAKDYSMVIIVTDGAPTVDDGPNHKWDLFAKNSKIDENFDGNENTASHVTRTKDVVDSLRQGRIVGSTTQTYAPVQVYGVLIGGGNVGATRMTNTYGEGNWYQSSKFDSTLGAKLLQIVGATCPPDPSLESGLQAQIVSAPISVVEDSDATYVVDITNNGSALLENVAVANGSVIDVPTDTTYTTQGYLSPGKKRRFSVTVHIGGATTQARVNLVYSAHVAEDPSLMAPGSIMDLSGTLSTTIGVKLIPRPA